MKAAFRHLVHGNSCCQDLWYIFCLFKLILLWEKKEAFIIALKMVCTFFPVTHTTYLSGRPILTLFQTASLHQPLMVTQIHKMAIQQAHRQKITMKGCREKKKKIAGRIFCFHVFALRMSANIRSPTKISCSLMI